MSENARASYQGNLARWIYPALGDVKLPEITPAQLSALLLAMQAQGKAQGTVLKVYTVLQGLFKMAYRSDTIPLNPMNKVDPRICDKGNIAAPFQRLPFQALENAVKFRTKTRPPPHVSTPTQTRRAYAGPVRSSETQ